VFNTFEPFPENSIDISNNNNNSSNMPNEEDANYVYQIGAVSGPHTCDNIYRICLMKSTSKISPPEPDPATLGTL